MFSMDSMCYIERFAPNWMGSSSIDVILLKKISSIIKQLMEQIDTIDQIVRHPPVDSFSIIIN